MKRPYRHRQTSRQVIAYSEKALRTLKRIEFELYAGADWAALALSRDFVTVKRW